MRDWVYAVRTLRSAPGFVLAAVLTLVYTPFTPHLSHLIVSCTVSSPIGFSRAYHKLMSGVGMIFHKSRCGKLLQRA